MTGFKIHDPSNFGLNNDPNMLNVTDPEAPPFEVKDTPDGVQVATKYFVIKVHTGPDGKSSQLELDSRPAFELAMLSIIGDIPHVMLVKKMRAEQRNFRDVEMITKVPGGYFHDGSQGNIDFVLTRIVQETGCLIDPNSVNFFGVVVGHPEIRTPIMLGYATKWMVTEPSAVSLKTITVPLEEALEMAENAVRRRKPFLENDTAFEGLMVIDRMLKRGEIVF